MLCPYEELQQPGRAAHVMPSTALRCAVSKDRGGTRARQGTGLWACTHLLLHPVQDSARHPAPCINRTLSDVYYLSHALPLQTNHQHKNPTSPPTTAITATEMPAMAPLLRPVLLTEGSVDCCVT